MKLQRVSLGRAVFFSNFLQFWGALEGPKVRFRVRGVVKITFSLDAEKNRFWKVFGRWFGRHPGPDWRPWGHLGPPVRSKGVFFPLFLGLGNAVVFSKVFGPEGLPQSSCGGRVARTSGALVKVVFPKKTIVLLGENSSSAKCGKPGRLGKGDY